MAAIFQIRRGSGSVSLVDGELYVNKGPDSLQYAVGTREITLAKLDELNTGSLNLSGDITASNAYFSGDVAISGNLFLGNASTDEITVGGEFQSNLIPNPTNTYSLGSSTKVWKEVHATSISGAIAATNGVISGSSQFIGILDSLNSYTQSNDSNISKLNESTASLNEYTASNDDNITELFATASNHETRINNLASITGSYATTGSNIFFGNQEVNGELNVITGSGGLTSSLTFTHNTSSIDDGYALLELRHNNDVYNDDISIKLKADFAGAYLDYEEDGVPYSVLSVQSFANRNIYIHRDTRLFQSSLRIDENLIVTGSVTVSGSLIVATDVYSPSFSGSFTGSFSGSLAIQDGRLDNLETTSGSHNIRLNNLESKSSSVDTSLTELNSYTQSLKTAITVDGVNTTLLGNLLVLGVTTTVHSNEVNIGDNIVLLNYGYAETEAGIQVTDASGVSQISGSLLWDSTNDYWKAGKKGSESKILLAGGDSIISSSLQLTQLNSSTESTNTRLGLLETSTGSLNSFTSSTNNRLTLLETSTGSLNEFTSSTSNRLDAIEISTGSLNTFSSSANSRLELLETSTGSLNTFTSSTTSRLELLETSTGSLNTFSSSTLGRLELLENSTGSLNTFSSSTLGRLELLENSTGSLNTFSSSTLGRLDLIETSTGSLNTFTSSANGRLLSLETETGSLEGRFTTLSQVTNSIHQFTSSLNTYTGATEIRLDELEYTASISVGAGLAAEFTKLNQFTASAQISIDNLESFTSSFSESVSASIAGLASASGYINYVTNSIEQLTGIEVADFDSNVAVTFIGGTLKFIFGTPAVPSSIAASLSGFLVDRFNNVNDSYIVNGTWSNQGYTLVSASLYEGSTLLTEVGSGTSLSYNATTSGSHTYRLEYTASSPLDGTLYKTSTTATGTISKSNPASPTISPTVTVQLGASSNQIEQGATGSISFTSSSADPSNGWDLINTTTNVSTPYFVTGSATGSTSISITATANYESPIGDNIPDLTTTSTATTTYTKIRSLRHGASAATSFTEGELENIGAWDTTLGGTIGTIVKGTTTASGQSVTISWTGDKFHYIVFNSSLSNLSNITTSGFGVLGQFSVTTVGQYKVYKTNTLQAGGAGSSITYTLT